MDRGELSEVQQGQIQGPASAMHQHRLGTNLLESNSVEKDLGVLVEYKLSLSQKCFLVAKKANSILECIRKSIGSRSREVILTLYSVLVRLHLEYLCPVLGSSVQERNGTPGRRATKMTNGLEHLSYEERLRELGLFSLEKRKLMNVCKYLKGGCQED
ncbi:hypothetical protein BTVI_142535 [Pitangus sulphuratus]|nr:hypothetical protein BTVI_142535 [Pitangus sulphuratus]